jgi:hypothetical protein
MLGNPFNYDEWYVILDAIIQLRTGLCLADLPDYNFKDAYDDLVSPLEAADEILRRGI